MMSRFGARTGVPTVLVMAAAAPALHAQSAPHWAVAGPEWQAVGSTVPARDARAADAPAVADIATPLPTAPAPVAPPPPDAPAQDAPTPAASAVEDPAPVDASPVLYRIGDGDRIKVQVYNAEKLSGEFTVGGDGKIAYPLLGRIPVTGLTLDEVSELVSMRLSDGYLVDPHVTVDMAGYRSVYILGEVARPGQYPYTEGMTIYQLVAQAGGFSYRANRGVIRLKREGENHEKKYRIENGSKVKPGDTIIIQQRFF